MDGVLYSRVSRGMTDMLRSFTFHQGRCGAAAGRSTPPLVRVWRRRSSPQTPTQVVLIIFVRCRFLAPSHSPARAGWLLQNRSSRAARAVGEKAYIARTARRFVHRAACA